MDPIRPEAGYYERLTKVGGMADGGHPVFTGVAECVNAHARQRPCSNISLSLAEPLPFPQPPPSSDLRVLPLKMSTSLDYLKATGTVVVSDSGDFESKLVSKFHHLSAPF